MSRALLLMLEYVDRTYLIIQIDMTDEQVVDISKGGQIKKKDRHALD